MSNLRLFQKRMMRPEDERVSEALGALNLYWSESIRNQNRWEIERRQLRERIAQLEGERSSFQRIEKALVERIRNLEYALRKERGQKTGDPMEEKEKVLLAYHQNQVQIREGIRKNILARYVKQFERESEALLSKLVLDEDKAQEGVDLRPQTIVGIPSLAEPPAALKAKAAPSNDIKAGLRDSNESSRSRDMKAPSKRANVVEASRDSEPKLRRTIASKYTLKHHLDAVRSISWHSEEAVLMTGSEDGLIKLWNVAEDGRKPGADVQPRLTLRGHDSEVLAVLLDNEGDRCFSAGSNGKVGVWEFPDLAEEEPVTERGNVVNFNAGWLTGHTDAVWDIALHNVESRLLTASADGTVKYWDLDADDDDEEEMEKFSFTSPFGGKEVPTRARFLPQDGRRFVAAFGASLGLFDIETCKCIQKMEDGGSDASKLVNSIALHHTTHMAIVGHEDHALRFWDLDSNKLVRKLVAHQDAVSAVDIHMDGLTLASGCHLGSIRIWDVRSYSCIQELSHHRPRFGEAIHDVSFHMNLNLLGTAGTDGVVKVLSI